QHPDLHQQVKRGEITLPTATRQARKRNHGQKLQTREKAIARATPPDMSDRKWTPPQVQMGDVWKLGPHRLHCGDSIHWRPGERAKMAFADPPYNSGVADWDRGFEWRHDWLQDAADYVFITPGTAQLPQFLGVTAMNYRWQYTYWVSNAVSRCNDWGMSNVIAPLLFSELRTLRLQGCRDFEKGAVSTGRTKDSKHPGRKPLGLLVWLMEMTTKPGDLIIDPFLGSGTTLFAAQGAQRVCHGMEINPHFCAEILARWYALTGTAPEKETMAIAQ
ncbi:MAG: DNA methyltransferase, partial [Cyanobacteria bacterium P01_H01_bin.130]